MEYRIKSYVGNVSPEIIIDFVQKNLPFIFVHKHANGLVDFFFKYQGNDYEVELKLTNIIHIVCDFWHTYAKVPFRDRSYSLEDALNSINTRIVDENSIFDRLKFRRYIFIDSHFYQLEICTPDEFHRTDIKLGEFCSELPNNLYPSIAQIKGLLSEQR